METFDDIFQRAAKRKGGKANLLALLEEGNEQQALLGLSSDRFLAAFTKKVFQSGFVWRVVENKWDGFEELFFQFEIKKLLLLPEEIWELKAQDKRIIRNLKKVKSIQANALMISDIEYEHGSMAKFIYQWPTDDITGLWLYLKKHGTRLGGNTGPYALRALGKDTFLMTRDVEAYLRTWDIISGGVGTKTSLAASQAFFNQLQAQSDYSLAQLSRLIAYSVGNNDVQ